MDAGTGNAGKQGQAQWALSRTRFRLPRTDGRAIGDVAKREVFPV